MNDTLIPHVRKVYFNFFRRMVKQKQAKSSLVLNKTGVWRR